MKDLLLRLSLVVLWIPNAHLRARSDFLMKLLRSYDNKLPPNFNYDEPLDVKCGIYINSFDSINESSMDIALSIYLRQHWVDDRLKFKSTGNDSPITLDSRLLSMVWVPDLFFTNEKNSHLHNVMQPNTYIKLYGNGTVSYSSRVSLVLACPMFLQKFPLDRQICKMRIETYAYNSEMLRFRWTEPVAVELNDDLEIPQFQLVNYTTHMLNRTFSTGNYSALEARFYLKRDIGFYVIQTYIPSMLIVILSWVSFWLHVDAVPARISLGVLTVLTMMTQTSGTVSSLPKVSYVKALDVWLFTCLIFVFGALLEFACVNVLTRKQREMSNKHASEKKHIMVHNGDFPSPSLSFMRLNVADSFSQKAFPLTFLIFNIIYWSIYMYT